MIQELVNRVVPPDFDIHIDNNGYLCIDGTKGFFEPICDECEGPISWVHDMMTFRWNRGRFVACHAACIWGRRKVVTIRRASRRRS